MKKTLVCLSVLSMLIGAAAQAADAPAITSNVTLTTKYKYRGQDQSRADKTVVPAIQGGFDYASGGFYIGNWNSSIGFVDGSDIEMDVYGGYKGQITSDIGFDVGVLRYQYPQFSTGNTTELYGGISWSFITAKLSYTASKRYFGLEEGRGTLYGDLSANYEVVKGVTLNGHIGGTRLTSDTKDIHGLPSFIDYKFGATYDLGTGFSLAGAYVGATKKDAWGDANKGRFIVSLTKAM